MQSLARSSLILHVAPDATAATTYTLAAGTTDVDSSSIDILGSNAKSVAWQLTFGTNLNAATFTLQVQESDDNSTWSNISGATVSVTDAGGATSAQKLMIEVLNPTKRYQRVTIDRGTANSAINNLEAIVLNTREQPNAQSTAAGQFAAAPVIVAG